MQHYNTVPWDIFWQNFLQVGIVLGSIGLVFGIVVFLLWKVMP